MCDHDEVCQIGANSRGDSTRYETRHDENLLCVGATRGPRDCHGAIKQIVGQIEKDGLGGLQRDIVAKYFRIVN